MADKYDLPPYVLSRVRYYDGEYLKDDEFIDEQKYHVDRRQRHDRLLHVAGVCEGMLPSLADPKTIKVAAGTAIDDQGHTILIDLEQTIAVKPEHNGALFIELLFAEKEDRPADGNSAVASNTRFSQAPVLQLAAAPHAHAIVLGQASILSGVTQSVTTTGRVYSGLRMPGPGNAGYLLHARGDSAPGLVDLECSLSVKGALQVSGAVGVGTATPVSALHVVGDVALGLNENNKRFIVHSRTNGAGDFLQITHDKADGSWEWTDGIALRRDGNAGVGTNAPSARLSVVSAGAAQLAGSAHSNAMRVSAGKLGANVGDQLAVASFGFIGDNNISLGVRAVRYRGPAGGEAPNSWQSSAIGLGMDVDNTVRAGASLFLTGDGNVGIGGQDTAGNKLRVQGGALFDGAVRAGGYMTGPASVAGSSLEVGGPAPTATNGSATIFLHHHGNIAHQLRYTAGQLFLEAAGNGYGTSKTPSLTVGGDIFAGNSALYFTQTAHNHSGFGNTAGYAAIENGASHDALMILGRAGTTKGRSVKLWDYLQVNGTLEVAGTLQVTGNRIKNNTGLGMFQTDAADWLRINPDSSYPGIAIYKPVAIGTGGLSVGDWTQLPQGQLKATAGGLLNSIGVGTQTFGATDFPYETIQMNPGHNLRIWFGTTQRFMLENSGQFTMFFDSGKWVFQTDGNLVKYRANGTVVWALNKMNGPTGW